VLSAEDKTDWLRFHLSEKALPRTGFPFEDGGDLSWRVPIDAWLCDLARHVHEHAELRLAMVGWAVGFRETSATIERHGVPESRWWGYLARIDGELQWFGPNRRAPVSAGGPGVDPILPALAVICPGCGETRDATNTTLVHCFCESRQRSSLARLSTSERDDFISFVARHRRLVEEWLTAREFPLQPAGDSWGEPRQDARKNMWACNECLRNERALYAFTGTPSAYVDLRGLCEQCSRAFLFSAEAQRYYSETRGFDTAPKRCFECRSGGAPKSDPRARGCDTCDRPFVPTAKDDIGRDSSATSAVAATSCPDCHAWKQKADAQLDELLGIAKPNRTTLLQIRNIYEGLGESKKAKLYDHRAENARAHPSRVKISPKKPWWKLWS